MKTFVQFLEEDLNGVGGMATNSMPMTLQRRSNLPQIDNHESLLQDLTISHVNVYQDVMDPNTLKPTQSEFNDEKVDYFVKSGKYNDKSILISSDGYIIDGHHRWKASQQAKDSIRVLHINKSYDDTIEFFKDKSYITYKKINEEKSELCL